MPELLHTALCHTGNAVKLSRGAVHSGACKLDHLPPLSESMIMQTLYVPAKFAELLWLKAVCVHSLSGITTKQSLAHNQQHPAHLLVFKLS